jgi:hypothetical protein
MCHENKKNVNFVLLFINCKNQKKMKKLLNLGLVLLVIFTIGACKGGDKPENVAKEFLTALNKLDYEKAKTFGNEETGKMVDMIKMFSGNTDEAKLAEAKKKSENVKIEITNTEMVGDSAAVCQYKVSGIEGQDAKEDKIDLIKKEGKWMVNWKKEGMGGEPAPEPVSEQVDADTTAVVAQ